MDTWRSRNFVRPLGVGEGVGEGIARRGYEDRDAEAAPRVEGSLTVTRRALFRWLAVIPSLSLGIGESS